MIIQIYCFKISWLSVCEVCTQHIQYTYYMFHDGFFVRSKKKMHISNSLFTCTWLNIENKTNWNYTWVGNKIVRVLWNTEVIFRCVLYIPTTKKLKMLFFAFVLQCKTFTIKKTNKHDLLLLFKQPISVSLDFFNILLSWCFCWETFSHMIQ